MRRANAIAPDYTITPGVRGNIGGPVDESKWHNPTPEQEAAMNRMIPLGRGGLAEECGSAALFLCPPAASSITGTPAGRWRYVGLARMVPQPGG